MKSLYKYSLVLLFSVAILSGLTGPSAHADTTTSNAAEGLQISPALVELNTVRGKSYVVKLTLLNVTANTLNYDSATNDFVAKDESGTPKILLNETQPSDVSIQSWVPAIPTLQLRPQERRTIDVTIAVPANAEAGGHYGVIRFTGSAPNLQKTGVGLVASAGTLLLIRVDGDVTEKAAIASFTAEQNAKTTSLFENSPINFVTRVQNIGNVHVKPVGSIEVRDMFNNLVTTLPVNQDKSNVLPASIRRFESTENKASMFGKYTADLTLGYGTTGQALTSQVTFWVIPFRLLLFDLIGLIAAIFILSKLLKLYNRHIITQSQKEKVKSHNTDKKK